MGLISDRDAGYDLRRPVAYDPGQRRPRRRSAHRGPVRRGGYRRRRGRTSVPVIAVIAAAASIVVVAAAVLGANRLLTARNAASATLAANPNCTLIVPVNPLSPQGLATPYQLTATDPAAGPCNEANSAQTAFVQGAVIDPATGQISVYDPLVIDLGTRPAIPPVVPALPAGAVVAVWFGFNGGTLSLAGPDQVSATPSQSASASAPSQSASAPSQSPSAPSQSPSAPSPRPRLANPHRHRASPHPRQASPRPARRR